MISNETLFLKTLTDIERRLSESDPYEILLIAGLLRKLFIDDHPLVDRVNQTHKIKLAFPSTQYADPRTIEPIPSFWSIQDGIDPDTAPPFRQRVSVSRDQFFKKVVALVGDHAFTVHDTILFEANVVGAVHAGSPRSEKEKALHELEATLSVGGYAASLRQLLAIARVCIKALAPLRAAVAGV